MARNQGIKSKNLVHPQYRTGAANRAIRPAGVAQLGASQGTHITEHGELPYRGISMKAGAALPSKLGNEIAAQTRCGPGGSRNVYRTGVQGQHGSVNPGGSRITDTRGHWPDKR
jgi:hypothetical protein